MKYLKTYDSLIEDGDYVILDDKTIWNSNSLKNKIGKVLRYRNVYNEIDVDFGKPIGIIHGMSTSNIKHSSPNKENLEILINTKKYNI